MKILKKLLFVITVLTAISLFPAISGAEEYKAGILSDYKFSGNDISDYSRDCIDTVFGYAGGSKVYYTDLDLANSIKALNEDKVDFVGMVPWNDAFSAYIDYTSEPVATGFLTLLTNTDNQIFFENFEKFNNIKIGILRNSYFENQLAAYSAQHNFTYIPVYFDTIGQLTDAAQSHEADAILVPSTEKPSDMRLIAKCGSFNYFCAVKKGNAEMLNILNSAISQLKADSPFYLTEKYADFFRNPYLKMAALTKAEYDALMEHETLKILLRENDYPMSYYDSETDRFEGVFVEIIRKIAENSGIELEFVSGGSNVSEDAITSGRADAILTVSDSKEGLVTATEPYTTVSYIPVGKKSTSVFEEGKLQVGILSEDDWISDYITSSHPNWNIRQFNSVNSLLRAAEHEKITVALLSSTDMQTKTSLIAHPKLAILDDFSIRIPVRLGISKITCKPQMVNLLNKIIKSVSVPESEFESRAYTLSHIYVPNFRDMIYANKIWLLIILLIFITIIAVIKMRETYFKRRSQTDALTGLRNKEYFNTAASKILSKSPSTPHLLVSLDPRNFKVINDRFGHIIGDQTLVNIANNIKDIFKDTCLYARSHGDRFLILTEDTPENRARIEKLTEMNIHIHNSSNYQVIIKTGVCPISRYDFSTPLSSYIDRANIAKSNASGRNKSYLSYFTKEMEQDFNIKNSIEIEMVKALERGDFIVYYQPKYELVNDSIIGAEALVRWNHKDRGIISPGLFIPLFEKNGFIVDLDFYVYESVLKMLKSRIISNLPVVTVSMNVSRCHLGDSAFAEKLEMLVNKYQVPKRYIEMEITESIFSKDDDSALSLIHELKNHGFNVSMDDFGSGYSSLNLLRQVPIDTLKIDKVFIDNTENSPRGQVIIEEIISMASKINVKTICEGVETKTQRDFLRRSGCDMVQGFFYSRPLPENDFEELLNSSN